MQKTLTAMGELYAATGAASGSTEPVARLSGGHLGQMPDPNGGNFPVAFGDFSSAYMLVDRSDLRITVDEVTSPGTTKFYIRKRVGGMPYNNDAVKFLKLL